MNKLTKQLERAVLQACVIIENDYRADLSANAVAQQVDVSPFRFQRAFRQMIGESYAQFVRRLRLERATYYLKDDSCEVRDIAAQSGFWTAAGFTRAFTKQFGLSPSAYRRSSSVPVRRRNATPDNALSDAGFRHRSLSVLTDDSVSVRIAFLRSSDELGSILQTWDRLLAITTAAGMVSPLTRFLGLHHDDWNSNGAYERYDAAITIPDDMEVPAPLASRTIPGGQIASTSVQGGARQIEPTWERFFMQWLPDSDLQPRLSYVYDEYFLGAITLPGWMKLRAALGGLRCRLVIPVSDTQLPINSPNLADMTQHSLT